MKKILYTIAAFICLTACQKEEVTKEQNNAPATEQFSGEGVREGCIRVKFKESAAVKMQVVTTRSGVVSTGLALVDVLGQNVKAYRMERVFPTAGKFEEKHRKYGLHLWYDVYFDEKIPTRSAAIEYGNLPEIDKVEPILETRLLGGKITPATLDAAQNVRKATRAEASSFNDPQLNAQWHYNNDGRMIGSEVGADINLFEAWKLETGSPKVIVAIVDGGIDYEHEDLAANMWINETENNGQEGDDDDTNGYIDDIHGYNFVTKSGKVTPHSHGTHVAGTISAVNNNGIGVCGVAGGSGKNDGVKLMSCQVFHINEANNEVSGGHEAAIIYGADNGAVICQNSWTYGKEQASLPQSIQDAIDYFIAEAGTDHNGNQTGPMKGGIVIFAAANEDSDYKAYPASYEKVLSVSGLNYAFKKGRYSNFADWIDIAAPGGDTDAREEQGILSTNIHNGYAYLQGTSMACPHVSGVAALVVSKFQAPGFTPDKLWDRLISSVKNVDQYNPDYIGKLGAGLVDARRAVLSDQSLPPEKTELDLIALYDNFAVVSWQVMTDPDDEIIDHYNLYWSTESLENVDLKADLPSHVAMKSYDVRFLAAGTTMRDSITGFERNTKYYFTLVGVDRWENFSEASTMKAGVTVKNQAPVLVRQGGGEILLDEGTTRQVSFDMTEPEGHAVMVTMTPEYSWLTAKIEGNVLTLNIEAGYNVAGTYKTLLTVTDQYGAQTDIDFSFEIMARNVAPVALITIPDMKFNTGGGEESIELDKYFSDPNKDPLIFELQNSNTQAVFVQRRGNKLVFTPKQAGQALVTIRAIDPAGLSASLSFSVAILDGIREITAYPNPVVNRVNIRLGDSVEGDILIRLYNAAGKQVIYKQGSIARNGTYTLDMQSLAAGTYVLAVEHNGVTVKKNIIKI